ncbi:uncharacterized protein TNCV_4742971 [Trichonephila clavipes]|nr:uncharacterized protein TNCV_4742971 [Trichonephila clavipes]
MSNAKRRVSAKRKRQFRGNGSTIKHSKNSSTTSTNASSSKIKIPAVFDEEIAEYQRKPLTGNRIIDKEVLLNLFLQLCCPRCFEEGILLSEDSTYGKLTDSFIDRLQNYYGIAVRSNVGNLSGLQQNVIAVLFHCSSSVEKPMHGECPIGKDSWCY